MLYTWSVKNFHKHEKNNDWSWSIGIFFLGLAILSFFYGNIFFGIFIILAGIMMIYFGNKEPKDIDVELSSKFLRINKTTYKISDMKRFAFFKTKYNVSLVIEMQKNIDRTISVMVNKKDINNIRDILDDFLPEENFTPSYSEQILNIIKY